MRFRILGSSSAGNCALICTPRGKVLIDAGFSGKRIETLLELAGTALHEIQAVFLTHEHGDHTAGIRGLTRRHPELRLFANRDTARAVQDKMERKLNWQVFETGRPFVFNDLEVSPFAIPHDAYDPVGYVFRCGGGNGDSGSNRHHNGGRSDGNSNSSDAPLRSLCWLTDLGYVPQLARQHARGCDLLVIEANHDPEMLENCQTRSWSTKQRIRGRHGHLSNQAAYDLLAAECQAGDSPAWKHICLAHISSECNSLEIVRRQFESLRRGARALDIHIFDPASQTPGAEFDLWADWRQSLATAATDTAATNADTAPTTVAAAASPAEISSAAADTALPTAAMPATTAIAAGGNTDASAVSAANTTSAASAATAVATATVTAVTTMSTVTAAAGVTHIQTEFIAISAALSASPAR